MLCRLWLERNKVKVYKTAGDMKKLFCPLKNVNWQILKQVKTWRIQHMHNNAAFHKIHNWATKPHDTGYNACWNLYEFRKGLNKLIWKIALGLLHIWAVTSTGSGETTDGRVSMLFCTYILFFCWLLSEVDIWSDPVLLFLYSYWSKS